MALYQTPTQKMTDLRIQRALAKPGAIGMKGFLLWSEAAWPPAIAAQILKAAGKYTPGAGPPMTLASPASQGFGHMHANMGAFGDVTVPDPNNPNNTIALSPGQSLGVDSTGATIINNPDGSVTNVATGTTSGGPTNAPVSAVTVATSGQPASPSWLADVGNAITAATTAYLGAQQVKDAQSIFNVNLQRAQQGLPPIPTNPTQYGLPAPTAQIGLTSQTTGTVLVVAALGAIALVTASAAHRRR